MNAQWPEAVSQYQPRAGLEAAALAAYYYFAHPYASWQRGLNGNTNRLIRQYLPKGCDFDAVSDAYLARIMAWLNHRPRKCLAMKTPYEVFLGESRCCTSEFNPPSMVFFLTMKRS